MIAKVKGYIRNILVILKNGPTRSELLLLIAILTIRILLLKHQMSLVNYLFLITSQEVTDLQSAFISSQACQSDLEFEIQNLNLKFEDNSKAKKAIMIVNGVLGLLCGAGLIFDDMLSESDIDESFAIEDEDDESSVDSEGSYYYYYEYYKKVICAVRRTKTLWFDEEDF